MSMQESVKSLKAYFIIIGILSLLSLGNVSVIGKNFGLGLIAVINILFSIIYIYFGLKLSDLLKKSSKLVTSILTIGIIYIVATGSYSILFNQAAKQSNIIFWGNIVIGILINAYLIKNIKRLSLAINQNSAGEISKIKIIKVLLFCLLGVFFETLALQLHLYQQELNNPSFFSGEIFLITLFFVLILFGPFIILTIIAYKKEWVFLKSLGTGLFVWIFIALIPFSIIRSSKNIIPLLLFIVIEICVSGLLIRRFSLPRHLILLAIFFPALANLYFLIYGSYKSKIFLETPLSLFSGREHHDSDSQIYANVQKEEKNVTEEPEIKEKGEPDAQDPIEGKFEEKK